MIEFEEKNNDAERMIADLKKQVLEVERAQNNIEQWLKQRTKESKRLEEDNMHLRKKPSNKSGLGFDKEKKLRYSSCTNQDGNKRSYVVALKSQIKMK